MKVIDNEALPMKKWLPDGSVQTERKTAGERERVQKSEIVTDVKLFSDQVLGCMLHMLS